ncbi:MAG: hypothetical protein ACFFHD_05620 [Promethearchaeota archaeon]
MTDVFDFSVQNGTLTEILQKINSFTDIGQGGIFGLFILIVVGGSLYFIMSRISKKDSFGITFIIVGILSILLRLLGLITDYILWISIALMILGVYLIYEESSNYE